MGRRARVETTIRANDDLGRANFGQRAKSAVVPARTRSAYHRIDAGMAFGKNDRPE